MFGPAVGRLMEDRSAGRQHWFDGEGHAGHDDEVVVAVDVMANERVGEEGCSDPVAAEFTDDRVAPRSEAVASPRDPGLDRMPLRIGRHAIAPM
jgi:hypothetical protein